MNLRFNIDAAASYKSNAQIIRVLSELWLADNMFCPICGRRYLQRFENNRPVADFYCADCEGQFELKSKKRNLGLKINDGAYSTMIERITSKTNPNFFFMTYEDYSVTNLMLVPNYFFTPAIIEKRAPLAPTARRAGWVGCNINIETIPESGKIFIVKQGLEVDPEKVCQLYSKTLPLSKLNLESRGWRLDVMSCIDRISSDRFSLNDIYRFEEELKKKYPNNNHIKDKIRQQLQYLRDDGFVDFTSRGSYAKIL